MRLRSWRIAMGTDALPAFQHGRDGDGPARPSRSASPSSDGLRYSLDLPRLDGSGPHEVDPTEYAVGRLLPPPGRAQRGIDFRVDGEIVARATTGKGPTCRPHSPTVTPHDEMGRSDGR